METAVMTIRPQPMAVVQARQRQEERLERYEAGVQALMNSKHLNEVDAQVVRNELNSPMLRWLSEDDRWNELVDIWSEVKLITGAIMYEGNMAGIQLRMLERFIAYEPQFISLTTAEIRHAFYLNNSGRYTEVYRHYNRELNAEFVGSILLAYMKYKDMLYQRSGKEIKGLLNPPQPKPIHEITQTDWMSYIQQDYEKYKAGQPELIFNCGVKYIFLRKCGLIPLSGRKKWWEWYRNAVCDLELKLRRQTGGSEGQSITRSRQIQAWELVRETGIIHRSDHLSVIFHMRRLIYMKFFELIADCAIVDIFTDIEHK